MNMRIAIVGSLMASLVGAPVVLAQDKCPAELRDARAGLMAASTPQGAPRAAAGYQGGSSEAPRGSVEAPRAAAGYQGGSSEAPRGSVEAPRAAAGYQGGSSEAPRGSVEAPRAAAGYQGGSSEAPRGSVEAPRAAAGYQGGSSEAPRAAAGVKTADAGTLAQARNLIAEAEADCKKGDMAASSQKAKAALEALK